MKKRNKTKKEKIQWHSGFYGATMLEFKEDESNLEFFPEETLSKKPLLIDLKIIKKKSNIQTKNEIGHIFKTHNILEYKSPKDVLNIDVFYKVIAYSCLYKSLGKYVDERPAEEITISIFREAKPLKLFQILRLQGYEIIEKYQGIYYITKKTIFPTQIIVMDELKNREHALYHLLSSNLKIEDLKNVMFKTDKFETQADNENLEALMIVAYQANQNLFKNIMGEYEMESYYEFLKEHLSQDFKDKLIQQGQEKGHSEGMLEAFAKMVKQGFITLQVAAQQMGMSESDFSKKMSGLAI